MRPSRARSVDAKRATARAARRRPARECARPRRRTAPAPDARRVTPTIGCRRKPLTGMSSGVSAPSTRTPSSGRRDLLVRLAQRRLLERFAGLDDAARQRDLAAVPQRRRARSARCARDRRREAAKSAEIRSAACALVVPSGKTSSSPAACRIRAGLKPAGHSRRGIGASVSCAAAPGSSRERVLELRDASRTASAIVAYVSRNERHRGAAALRRRIGRRGDGADDFRRR